MPLPLILLALPLVAGAGAFLLRRWRLASVLTGMATSLILLVVLIASDTKSGVADIKNDSFLTVSWVIQGRSLILEQLSQYILMIVYGSVSLFLSLSLVLWQDRFYVPLILLALTPLAGTVMAESISTGTLFLVIGMVIMAVLIQGEKAGSTLTSIRYLSLAVLVFPILLVIGWMVETRPVQFLTWMPFLLLVAFLILLLSFPFHLWVSPAVSRSNSLVPVVVFGLVQLVVVIFCLRLIVDNPVVYGNIRLQQLLRASGAVTMLLASLLILTAPSISRLVGYLLIIDLGSSAVALGLGGKIGLELVTYMVLMRIVGLLMAGFGLGMVRRQVGAHGGEAYKAFKVDTLARRSPIGLALVIYGGLSLAGLPLTPGFAGRWVLLGLVRAQYQWIAFIIVIVVVSAVIGLARMLLPNPSSQDDMAELSSGESRAIRIVAGLLLVVGGIFTLISPQLLSLSLKLVNLL